MISDSGLQFTENLFRSWCAEKGIEQRFTSVVHPRTNGKTEVSNSTLINGIKKRLGKLGRRAPRSPLVKKDDPKEKHERDPI